jgi:ribonuclease BN (tRNA processing enzyme)
VRLTVLGKSPAWQDAGGACSGYLIEAGGTTLLLDCGNGVFAKLRERVPYDAVDAVVISHMHADHFFDLVSFSHALLLGPRSARPHLIVPPGGREVLRAAGALWNDPELVQSAFEVEECGPAAAAEVGAVRLRFTEVPHFIYAQAVEVSADRARLTFGADCAPNEGLVEFARDTDLLMVEATQAEHDSGSQRGHMTAREAGALGRRAGASRLVLTHFSDELDEAHARAEGEAGFGASVELASEGATYELGA